jgi:hypothetical protein
MPTTSCVPEPKQRRGAQPGNRQALKSGLYTAEVCAIRSQIWRWQRTTRALLAMAKKELRTHRADQPGRTL